MLFWHLMVGALVTRPFTLFMSASRVKTSMATLTAQLILRDMPTDIENPACGATGRPRESCDCYV